MSTQIRRREMIVKSAALAVAGLTFPIACARAEQTSGRNRPRRVVALGYIKDADAAIACGVVPVAVPHPSRGLRSLEPWIIEALQRLGAKIPNYIDINTQVPLEQVAAARPDIILATGLYSIDQYRDRLTAIAPLIGPTTGPNSDSWRETTLNIGAHLGKISESREAILNVEHLIKESRDLNPVLEGKKFTFSYYSQSSGFETKVSPNDVLTRSLSEFGLRLSPAVMDLPRTSTAGMGSVPQENADILAADVSIVSTTSNSDSESMLRDPGWHLLKSKSRGAVIQISRIDSNSLAFASALSLSYVAKNVITEISEAISRNPR